MPMNDFEFDMMQEQAIRQAREMFSRASHPEPDFEFEKKETHEFFALPENKKTEPEKRAEPLFSGSITPNRTRGMSAGIFKDKDIMLILALILLLSGDGGDKLLILALIYIMS